MRTSIESTSVGMPSDNPQNVLVEPGLTDAEQQEQLEQQERAQLLMLAAKYHVSLMPNTLLLARLGEAIKSKMIQRCGKNVYQMGEIEMPYFPLLLLDAYLPPRARSDVEGAKMWLLDSVELMLSISRILSAASTCAFAGLTKAFCAKSQPFTRVVGALMPDMEILYTPIDTEVGTVKVNFQYVLMTEHGESHWPKDRNRREIAFDPETVTAVNEQVLSDALALGESGHPLSPGWWRQLGNEEKAREIEEELARPRGASARSTTRVHAISKKVRKPRQRRFTKEVYDIEAIIDEKRVASKAKMLYLVRWVGWDEPTWEPVLLLKDTEALQAWRARRLC